MKFGIEHYTMPLDYNVQILSSPIKALKVIVNLPQGFLLLAIWASIQALSCDFCLLHFWSLPWFKGKQLRNEIKQLKWNYFFHAKDFQITLHWRISCLPFCPFFLDEIEELSQKIQNKYNLELIASNYLKFEFKGTLVNKKNFILFS